MAAFVKSKLKAARDAINKKDFNAALSAAREVLSFESNNYNALVFSGLALFELGNDLECEQTYLTATEITPDQPLAWQGLLKLHERTKDYKKTFRALENLMRLYCKAEDPVRCAETVQRIIQLQRDHGTRLDVVAGLELLLPGSLVYPLISTLPPPVPTQPTATTTFAAQSAVHNSLPLLEEMVGLLEVEEDKSISSEVDRRRMRLDAGRPEDIRNEVGYTIWGTSKLPFMYDEIINHPSTSDELRRSAEGKLFRYRLKYLKALPFNDPKKETTFKMVDEMMRGMVLLGIPDELIWTQFLESKNVGRLDEYNFETMRRYLELFPLSSLAQAITGFFQCTGVSLREDTDPDEPQDSPVDYETAFQTVLDACNSSQTLILPYRFLSDLYLKELDYQNTIKTSEAGVLQVQRVEKELGRSLSNVAVAFRENMATGLVHHFPPKHHPRALGIIEQVLAKEPNNVPCLLAHAYVLRYSQKYTESRSLFVRVARLVNKEEDRLLYLEAKEEVAWCDSLSANHHDACIGLRRIIDELEAADDHAERKARVWWRLGQTLWDKNQGNSREEAYSHFITSLKRDPSFAPAFTSLGVHYSEHADPPDPVRASKCLQKAVELDYREGDAARRLAEGFADEREWDLVEVVARRTIEGEGGAEGDVTSSSVAAARYKPVNAWAWKSIGVVELNRGNFQPAIISLQIALRADETDYRVWIRLGEAYSRSGRPAAALKALNRAHELAPDEWTCVVFTADVYRQMGLYETAISMLEQVLHARPGEVGILVALAESHLALGRSEFAAGFQSRAEISWSSAIIAACSLLSLATGYKRIAWKTVADALFELSKIASFTVMEVSRAIRTLSSHFDNDVLASDINIAGTTPLNQIITEATQDLNGNNVIWLAAAAYHIRIRLCEDDNELEAAAFYDYAVACHRLVSVCAAEKTALVLAEGMSSAKSALRHDSGNEACWNALGTMSFPSNPMIAQHSFIRAIELDQKNPVYWTNLGLLYLHHGDSELANQALYKAQVLNPEYSLAWVGQAFVAIKNGHLPEAKAVLEHAITLPVPIPQAEYEYAHHTFLRLAHPAVNRSVSPEQLITPFFALRRYCGQLSEDSSGLHLFALLCERLRQHDLAIELLVQAIAILERAYEETEDPTTEKRYAIANANLGRVRLAMGDHQQAKVAFDVVLGLLDSPVEEGSVGASNRALLLAQAHFGIGLASFKLGGLADALTSFEASANAAPFDMQDVKGHITILTAQTLWAIGSEDAREAARDQLLECVGNDSENLAAITTLAAIGILTGNEELVQASLSDLLSASPEKRRILDPTGDVDRLLVLNALHSGDTSQAHDLLLSGLQSHTSPERGRLNLAEHFLQIGDASASREILYPSGDRVNNEILISHASRDDLYDKLRLNAVALMKMNTHETPAEGDTTRELEAISMASKSVVFAPWESKNWAGLAFVRTQSNPTLSQEKPC